MALMFILIGSLLLAVNLIGRLRGAVPAKTPHERAPVDGFDYRQFPPSVARARFRTLKRSRKPDREKVESLFHLVSGSVIHRKYRLDFFDNWLVRIAGLFYPELRNTQDARLLWVRGAGKCDQVSLLLLAKARELGIEGRILGLDGHILVETECGGKKQVIDVDMGRFWNCAYEELRSMDKIELTKAYEQRGFSNGQAEHNAWIIRESPGWSRIEFPPAKSRYQFEKLSAWLMWLLPCVAILYGIS